MSNRKKIKNVKIQKMPEELMTGCEYRKYILSECRRQWKENQEELYGPWEKQSTAEREQYYCSLYEQCSDLLGKSCSSCAYICAKNNSTFCSKLNEKVTERNYCEDFKNI